MGPLGITEECMYTCMHTYTGDDLLLVGWFPMLEMINWQCRHVDGRFCFAMSRFLAFGKRQVWLVPSVANDNLAMQARGGGGWEG